MAHTNTLTNTQLVLGETLFQLKNNLVVTPNTYRGYDDLFGNAGNKIGTSANGRKPQRFIGRAGRTYSPENVNAVTFPIVLNTLDGVDFEFFNDELLLSVDKVKERYASPASVRLSNIIDSATTSFCTANTFNFVGTPGTALTSWQLFLAAKSKLMRQGMPSNDQVNGFINSAQMTSFLGSQITQYNPQPDISKNYRNGQFAGDIGGVTPFISENIVYHTNGVFGAGAFSIVSVSGSTVVIGGVTANTGTINAGDRFTVAGRFFVNPQTRAATRDLFTAVVLTGGTANGSGQVTVTISPTPNFNTNTQYQNVSSAIAASDVVTFAGTSGQTFGQALVFHKQAFSTQFGRLPAPTGAVMATEQMTDPDTGVPITYIQDFDTINYNNLNRMDVLFGNSAVYNELSCVIYTD